jgi:hypothetical protein
VFDLFECTFFPDVSSRIVKARSGGAPSHGLSVLPVMKSSAACFSASDRCLRAAWRDGPASERSPIRGSGTGARGREGAGAHREVRVMSSRPGIVLRVGRAHALQRDNTRLL